MSTLSVTISVYVLTILFAMVIAALIHGMGFLVKLLRLDGAETLDISVPTANSLREDELMAVALAAAHARRQKP